MDTDMDHAMPHTPNGAGHEHSEISVRTVVVSLAALLIGVVMVVFLVIGIFRFFHSENHIDQTIKDYQQQIPPEPRVEERPYEQLASIRAREDHVLSTFAWVDKNQGVVRIPIEQAIDKLAQQGLPTHDYMADMQAGKKAAAVKPQGTVNAAK
jgi:hypothetical protein